MRELGFDLVLVPADARALHRAAVRTGGNDAAPARIFGTAPGAYGAGAKMYRSGPYQRGKPEQGYQLALTPRQYFEAGIAAANDWSRKTYGKEFDRLSAADRATALKAMEEGKAQFEHFSATGFFNRVLAIVMEGMFSDPMYGGNRNKVGWQMLGFPGLPATYADKVDAYYNKRYVAPPRSIADFS